MFGIDALVENPVYFIITSVFGVIGFILFLIVATIYYFYKKKPKKLKDMNVSNRDFSLAQGKEVNKKSEHEHKDEDGSASS